MPWKETDVMTEKQRFALQSIQRGVNFTELCKSYSISTKTGYKWRNRFIEEGIAGLEEGSREPRTNRKKLDVSVALEIVRIKQLKKHWGASKILAVYQNNHPDRKAPVRSTVERVLRDAGLMERKKRKRYQTTKRIQTRYTAKGPNDIWTVDFKGWWYTPNREKCEPLTVRDAYSRYILSIKVLEKGDMCSVKGEFEKIFKKNGLPRVIRSDNGPPFACAFNALGLTKLAVWWMSLGIQLDRIDPGSPSQNGAHERMHRDMKQELEGQIDGNLKEHQRVFDAWREEYNNERPHAGIGNKTPASLYRKSERRYEEEVERIEYPRGYKSRMVNDRGVTHYKNRRIFIGNPFAGYNVGIKPLKNGDLEVWFDNFQIGRIDSQTNLYTKGERDIKVQIS